MLESIQAAIPRRVLQRSWLQQEHLLVLLAAAAGVILFQVLRSPHPFDDAFITFRYARSIASGAGFVYNPAEPVLGTTTPLYTLILAALALLFGAQHLLSISLGIAAAADIASVVLLYRLSRHILSDRLLAALLSAVFLLHPLRLVVAGGGMETSLFVTVLLLMYDAYLIRRSMTLAAVMAALSIWLRPDAVLAVAPLLAFTAWRSWRQALRMGLITAAILLPWLLFATFYFGSPIPHSILAKQALYTSNYLTFTYYFLFAFLATGTLGLYRSIPALLPTFIAAILLIVSGLRVYLRRLDPALVLVLYPILYYLVMFQQKAPMFFIWYYIPLLPGFLLLFWAAVQHFATRLPAHLHRLAFVSTAILLVGVPSIYTHLYPEWTTVRDVEGAFQSASRLVQPQVQPGQVVYAPDIGVIGWELSQAYILDSVGLVSPQVIDYYAAIGSYDRMNPAAIAHFRPDYIIAITPLFEPLLTEPSFTAHYQLAGVGVQGASSVSVYSRRP